MKTMRIVNEDGCVFVERYFFGRWWIRVSPYYKSNIEAYNYVRRQRNVDLIKQK